jgi:hypothetical protein
VAAGDNRMKIPRWHVYSCSAFEGEECVLKELTDLVGDFKAEWASSSSLISLSLVSGSGFEDQELERLDSRA